MKLFNYGKNHKSVFEKFYLTINPYKIDSLYSNSNYEEAIILDRCNYNDQKITSWKGEFKNKSKTSKLELNTKNIFIGKQSEYFKLPNEKDIDLRKEFAGYEGNKFYSLFEDKTENRIIFYFESESNHNACGQCGASEGEKGYRIIYFDKNWKITKKAEFSTESCLESIDDAEIVNKTKSGIKYKVIKNNFVDPKITYFLNVNKIKSTINKTNN